jgi:hypothetical protein
MWIVIIFSTKVLYKDLLYMESTEQARDVLIAVWKIKSFVASYLEMKEAFKFKMSGRDVNMYLKHI